MTLSNECTNKFSSSPNSKITCSSSGWNTLYGSRLWNNSDLRGAILHKNIVNTKYVPKETNENSEDCFTDEKIDRNNDLSNHNHTHFVPNNHSTPNNKIVRSEHVAIHNSTDTSQLNLRENVRISEDNICIPSISRQVDSSFRHKYSSSEVYSERNNNSSRLRKCGIKGLGCIVNLTITETPIKKRTQIQACSISIMIVAIVVISFVLVNFISPSYRTNTTIAVPTKSLEHNSTYIFLNANTNRSNLGTSTIVYSTTDNNQYIPTDSVTENSNIVYDIISKIRKNIRTFPKGSSNIVNEDMASQRPKEINNRDLSQRFCKCQNDEVCMLDEGSGTAICRQAVDGDDPTGCGGLCALETEACQMVDRARGVHVCRQLALVTCSPDEWRCHNGVCVSASARCDGSIDCYDKSDEKHCECDLTKQFRCGHSISCFSNQKLCDGNIDCWDGFDEFNCTTECPENQFTCNDGQCILRSRFCDGFADCADSSDEPSGCDTCRAHELKCGNKRCISQASRCDGVDQCGDATDEEHCS